MLGAVGTSFGVCGKEGLAAANASTYKVKDITQIPPLMATFGPWFTIRMKKMFLYFFYRNIASMTIILCFIANPASAFMPLKPFYDFYVENQNLVFTTMTMIPLAYFSRKISYRKRMLKPQLYSLPSSRDGIVLKSICFTVGNSIITGFVIYLLLKWCLYNQNFKSGLNSFFESITIGFNTQMVLKAILEIDSFGFPFAVSISTAILLVPIIIFANDKSGVHSEGPWDAFYLIAACLIAIYFALICNFTVKSYKRIFRSADE